MAESSDSPFFSSPSSSLGVSARFIPTDMPLRAVQGGGGEAEGGCPVEEPEWEGRGGEVEGELGLSTMEDGTTAVVDTVREDGEAGEGEGEGREEGWGRDAGVPGWTSGGVRGGGGREGGEGREEGVAMSTSPVGEEGMEVDVECCSLVREGGAAGP
jgi:hypothetical protein